PVRVWGPRPADGRRHGWRDAMRTPMRRAALFSQPGNARVHVARDPLVARLAADAIARAELGHCVELAIPVCDEVHPFLHGVRLRPRHAHLPVGSLEECHPCCRSDLLPMYPVCTVPRPNMALDRTRMSAMCRCEWWSARRSTPG